MTNACKLIINYTNDDENEDVDEDENDEDDEEDDDDDDDNVNDDNDADNKKATTETTMTAATNTDNTVPATTVDNDKKESSFKLKQLTMVNSCKNIMTVQCTQRNSSPGCYFSAILVTTRIYTCRVKRNNHEVESKSIIPTVIKAQSKMTRNL